MNQGIKTIIYPVKDIAQATKLYSSLLGTEPYMAQPYYVGFKVGEQEVGLDPHGHSKGMTGPLGYYHVSDIRESVRLLLDAGGQSKQEVHDLGGGKLMAVVQDADGNTIGLIQEP